MEIVANWRLRFLIFLIIHNWVSSRHTASNSRAKWNTIPWPAEKERGVKRKANWLREIERSRDLIGQARSFWLKPLFRSTLRQPSMSPSCINPLLQDKPGWPCTPSPHSVPTGKLLPCCWGLKAVRCPSRAHVVRKLRNWSWQSCLDERGAGESSTEERGEEPAGSNSDSFHAHWEKNTERARESESFCSDPL